VIESRKAAVRANAEHPFLIVKRDFGFTKTRYRGIAKNLNHLHVLFAAVALTGTGAIRPLRFLGALAVLAGVILGLGRARQVPAGNKDQAGQRAQLSAETAPAPAR
jgi:hypothetical protein